MLECDGSCEEHRGEVKEVLVQGWGHFNYCEEAIEEDIRRGFTVVVDQEEREERKFAWLGTIAEDERTYLEHINTVVKHAGVIPLNAFIDVTVAPKQQRVNKNSTRRNSKRI